MTAKSILILSLAALCFTGMEARSKKKKQAKKPAVELVKPVDAKTFSYAMGISQSEGLKRYLQMNMGVDTAYMAEAIKGLTANISAEEVKKATAYAAGLRIAQMNREQIIPSLNKQATGKQDTTFTDLALFNKGLEDGMLKKEGVISADSAMKIVEQQYNYFKQEEKKANMAFLKANAKRKGVTTTKSGLQYEVITKGTGALPTDTSEVEVFYEGKLIDGTVFDGNYTSGKTTKFKANQVIKGWTEALKLMPVGSEYMLYIPYDLAYGERGGRSIPPFSTLIFKVKLVSITQPKAAKEVIPATKLIPAKKK